MWCQCIRALVMHDGWFLLPISVVAYPDLLDCVQSDTIMHLTTVPNTCVPISEVQRAEGVRFVGAHVQSVKGYDLCAARRKLAVWRTRPRLSVSQYLDSLVSSRIHPPSSASAGGRKQLSPSYTRPQSKTSPFAESTQ